MPNICSYDMRVRGDKEKVKTFYNWLSSTYNYGAENPDLQVYRIKDDVNHWEVKDEDKIPSEHHIGYRVFDAWLNNDIESGEYASISGDCAWSCTSCMFNNGIGTYMGDKDYGRPTDKAISIVDASKELGIEIELFSEEPGCEFSEHYYIKNGEILLDDTREYLELWLEYFDKNSESYEEDYYNELSPEIKALVDEAIKDGSEDVLTLCDNIDDCGCYKYQYII